MPKNQTKVRLPKHITPIHYKLSVKPDMEAFTFSGEETISLTVNKSSKKIVLHSKDLEITDGWLLIGKTKITINRITYQSKEETATLELSKIAPIGKAKITLHFRGILSDSLRGFYKSTYQHLGQTKHIATTQFESTDARRAFPCFDEPAHKAIFEVSLVIPKHLTAISNSIESFADSTPQGVHHDPGYKIVNFTPTPKMSTYLLAFIIGEFESVETKTKDGVRIRIFVPLGRKAQTKFALDVTKRTLEFLNEYFAIPYPLPVLNLIAIPDFSAGAMENWGAITFRETALLIDEQHSAFTNKQNVTETIVHELVHQWFGNLVTMEWWTHLWLNESFAPFMANLTMDHLFPEWKIWTRFVLSDHGLALELDSLENTHPIEVEVHHPDQIAEIFDAISYDKGASVLRMLYHYIGPDFFRAGLRYYLKKHSYKNTSSVDLWEAFEKVSKKPIRKFMNPWVSVEGYPLLTITEQAKGKLKIVQERFTLSPKIKAKTTWPVPVQLRLSGDKVSKIEVLSGKQKVINIIADIDFIKANPDETGFYRTLYSPSLLAKLYEPIRTKQLDIIDRFGIIRDLGALIQSGHLSSAAYLEFLPAYQNEDSYIIWAEICEGMNSLYNIFRDDPKLQQSLAKYFRRLMKSTVELVGWDHSDQETHARSLLRALILTQYGLYGDKPTIAKAKAIFASRNKKPIPPNMRNLIYTLVGLSADKNSFATLHKMFADEHLQEEKRRLGKGLTAIKNKALFNKVLSMQLSKEVRPQDAPIYIHEAIVNTHNREEAWVWVQKNWDEIRARYDKDHLLYLVVSALGNFSSKSKAKELSTFFKKHPAPSVDRAIKQAIEQIDLNTAWLSRDRADIKDCINRRLEL